MTTDYRSQPLVCPRCAALLEPHQLDDCLIDTCPACAGIWIDWHDGPLHAVVRKVPARTTQARSAPEWHAWQCPRCRAPLVAERFETGDLAVVVLRCGDCAGAFVDDKAAAMLAATLAPVDHAGTSPKGLLSRLAAALKDLMFGNSEGRV